MYKEILSKLEAIEKKLNKEESGFDKFLKLFEKLLLPITVLILSFFTQRAGEKISNAQLESSKQQFSNQMQSKYLEIFYQDITSKDSIKKINSLSLLSLMNDSLAAKLRKWVITNPNISNQIKQSLVKQDISVDPLKHTGLKRDFFSFIHSIENNDLESVKLFLTAGFSPNIKGSDGNTPLSIAIKNGFYDIFELLIKYHANLKYNDSQGRNYLHVVVWGDDLKLNIGHIKIAKWLLKNGFKVNSLENDGGNALITAVYIASMDKNDLTLQMVKLLLEAGANPCISNNAGNNSFSEASDDDLKKLLHGVKSDCNSTNT